MLTKRQKQLLEFLRAEIDNGLCPTFQDMADALGIKSKSAVHRLILALEERGFIRRMRDRARAIEIIDRDVIRSEYARGFEDGFKAACNHAGRDYTTEDIRKAKHVEERRRALRVV